LGEKDIQDRQQSCADYYYFSQTSGQLIECKEQRDSAALNLIFFSVNVPILRCADAQSSLPQQF